MGFLPRERERALVGTCQGREARERCSQEVSGPWPAGRWPTSAPPLGVTKLRGQRWKREWRPLAMEEGMAPSCLFSPGCRWVVRPVGFVAGFAHWLCGLGCAPGRTHGSVVGRAMAGGRLGLAGWWDLTLSYTPGCQAFLELESGL